MQLGIVGLGRMGGNMAERLRAGGHDVIGYDAHSESSAVASLDELVEYFIAKCPRDRVRLIRRPHAGKGAGSAAIASAFAGTRVSRGEKGM